MVFFLHPLRLLVFGLALTLIPFKVDATRVKDVARVEGPSDLQLIGYGMVIGLRGTGDGPRTQFTTQSVLNLLRNMGIEPPKGRIQIRNAAAVMVTSKLTPYLKKGATLDVSVSSLGDAKSLEGGTLLLSPLQGPDGEVYALAQGALSVGGMQRDGALGRASLSRNHALAGEVPGGGLVQREAIHPGLDTAEVRLSLQTPDFTSASALAKAVNLKFGSELARAADPATVRIVVPGDRRGKLTDFLSEVENLDFIVSRVARVVLNEKTGTVIAGGEVTISQIAVAHGNITVEIKATQETTVQQGAAPGVVTQQNVKTDREDMKVAEDKAEMRVLSASASVAELAKSLNTLGVTPRDIIAIFSAIKKAGALNAELVVM